MGSANHRKDMPRRAMSASAIMRDGDKVQLCLVENISPKGACLKVNPDLKPMDRFELLLQDQEPILVTSMWRSQGRVGVRRLPRRSGIARWLDQMLRPRRT